MVADKQRRTKVVYEFFGQAYCTMVFELVLQFLSNPKVFELLQLWSYYSFGATPVLEPLHFSANTPIFELLQFLSYYAAFELLPFLSYYSVELYQFFSYYSALSFYSFELRQLLSN
jgi:hypothetical protein